MCALFAVRLRLREQRLAPDEVLGVGQQGRDLRLLDAHPLGQRVPDAVPRHRGHHAPVPDVVLALEVERVGGELAEHLPALDLAAHDGVVPTPRVVRALPVARDGAPEVRRDDLRE